MGPSDSWKILGQTKISFPKSVPVFVFEVHEILKNIKVVYYAIYPKDLDKNYDSIGFDVASRFACILSMSLPNKSRNRYIKILEH